MSSLKEMGYLWVDHKDMDVSCLSNINPLMQDEGSIPVNTTCKHTEVQNLSCPQHQLHSSLLLNRGRQWPYSWTLQPPSHWLCSLSQNSNEKKLKWSPATNGWQAHCNQRLALRKGTLLKRIISRYSSTHIYFPTDNYSATRVSPTDMSHSKTLMFQHSKTIRLNRLNHLHVPATVFFTKHSS